MQEGGAGARQILHAKEHTVLLGRRAHQESLRVPLAGLQRNAGVSKLAAQKQRLEVDKRLINHNRFDLRQFLYNTRWPRQFNAIDKMAADAEKSMEGRGKISKID